MASYFFPHSLGCDIGYGYLHRIPVNPNVSAAKPPTPVPEETAIPSMPAHGYTEVSVQALFTLFAQLMVECVKSQQEQATLPTMFALL